MPFNFTALDSERYVLSSLGGEYVVLPKGSISQIVEGKIDLDSPLGRELIAKNILYAGDRTYSTKLTATQLRSRYSILPSWTGLHIFVVTLRCDHSCKYCQVSRVTENKAAFDMSIEHANLAVDFMLTSPNPALKVEFQGGESTLNLELVEHIIRRVEEKKHQRNVSYVITTNLAHVTDKLLNLAKRYQISFSTSLDGPAALHNSNRPRPGGDSHERTIQGIKRIRTELGHRYVSALMTTTAASLQNPEAIIDEYVRQGFNSIFLRGLSPYGFAQRSKKATSYEQTDFTTFYKRALDYIFQINLGGFELVEEYSALIATKLLTPFPTGYVDLQSPAGIGISAIIYNYDGSIYASDEGRMLAEMGDYSFKIGTLKNATQSEVFLKSGLLELIHSTMAEGTPSCEQCALLPYCGTDPVFHWTTQKDVVGYRPTSEYCNRNMTTIRHLIKILEDCPVEAELLRKWAKRRQA